jgi:hypothetical protein
LVGWSVGLQNKFCYEVAFKTRIAFNERDISPKHRQKTSFAMKLPSKQGMLSMRGIIAQNTEKQANKNINSFCLSTVTPCQIGVPWPGPAVLKYQGYMMM